MTEASLEKKILMALVFAFIATAACGAFAISAEHQHKVETANEIRKQEQEISRLRRENEELSVKIAKQENPALLTIRAGNRLTSPRNGGIVWAYENFDGGRVEFNKSKGVLSFRTPQETKNTKR